MPENIIKVPQDASPVARTGGGDISQRELNRERNALQTTPPTYVPNPKYCRISQDLFGYKIKDSI